MEDPKGDCQGPCTGSASKTFREFTKGGLVKRGLAMYAFPLYNRNTLGYVFDVRIEKRA